MHQPVQRDAVGTSHRQYSVERVEYSQQYLSGHADTAIRADGQSSVAEPASGDRLAVLPNGEHVESVPYRRHILLHIPADQRCEQHNQPQALRQYGNRVVFPVHIYLHVLPWQRCWRWSAFHDDGLTFVLLTHTCRQARQRRPTDRSCFACSATHLRASWRSYRSRKELGKTKIDYSGILSLAAFTRRPNAARTLLQAVPTSILDWSLTGSDGRACPFLSEYCPLRVF